MKVHFIRTISIAGVLILLGACAQMAGRTTPEPLSGKDAQFMEKAAMGGVAEVRLGQIALQNAANEEVKRFAHDLVNDHTVADQQLRNIAEKKNVDLPAQPGEEHRRTAERLAALKGPEFDRQYLSEMVKDHQETIDRYREQTVQGQDAEVRAFADRNLPVLQQHLDRAKALHGKMGG